MSMYQKIIMIAFVCLLWGCQEKVKFEDADLQSAYNEYTSEKNEEQAKNFASKVVAYLVNNPQGTERELALQKGIEVSEEHELVAAKASFTTTLLKDYPNSEKTPDRIFDLAQTMKKAGKEEAANALAYSMKDRYKNHPKTKEAEGMISAEIENIDDYIKNLGEGIFQDPNEFGINRGKAQSYVDACEAYAMVNPENVMAPEFLYKASETARTLRTFPKALSLYDWIITDYPDYEKTPTALFLKGYILENDLNDLDRAKENYQSFLSKYPTHHLADDVTFLLENIGKSDDEILELITKNRKDS